MISKLGLRRSRSSVLSHSAALSYSCYLAVFIERAWKSQQTRVSLSVLQMDYLVYRNDLQTVRFLSEKRLTNVFHLAGLLGKVFSHRSSRVSFGHASVVLLSLR